MGTNYYLRKDYCPHCERYEQLHIGKSSAGWCFALHVYPEQMITTLTDWKKLLAANGSRIVDEYGHEVPGAELLRIITERSWAGRPIELGTQDVHGPHGLGRHAIDGRFCIGHGEGTWDYLVGEFS